MLQMFEHSLVSESGRRREYKNKSDVIKVGSFTCIIFLVYCLVWFCVAQHQWHKCMMGGKQGRPGGNQCEDQVTRNDA